MTDRPILFSGPMVRALLTGTKTQTRRVAIETTLPHLQHADDIRVTEGAGLLTRTYRFRRKFAVGDRLWVREAWRSELDSEKMTPRFLPAGSPIEYIASGVANMPSRTVHFGGRLRQAMHMPRWASRLTLTVTEIRVLRLQEISEADAIAEGAPLDAIHRDGTEDGSNPHMVAVNPWTRVSPVAWYHRLWDSLNAERGYGWDANPWVVAVTFTVEPRNIDQVRP